MDIPNNNNEQPGSNALSDKRRKKRSAVWIHFDIETVGAGPERRAFCKHCKKSFTYITGTNNRAGTSHLKRHTQGCLGSCQNMATSNVPSTKYQYKANPGLGSMPFRQDHSNYELAKMVILDDLPLNFAEQPGFVDFIRTLQPKFGIVGYDNIEADCLGIYLREKQSLLNLFHNIPGHVSLTVDSWTSDQAVTYAIVTGHFVDTEWELNRCILSVVKIPSPNSETSCGLAVKTCITDWNLNEKLLTITFNKSFADIDIVGDSLRGMLFIKNPLVLNGQLLISDCYSRVMSRLAQETLGSMDYIVDKIRETLKYVESSEAVEHKFMEHRQQLQVPRMKSLTIDDVTKWDTTYNMLVMALELKDVFSCLRSSDPDYKEALCVDEWKQVETLCKYLKLFFDATNVLRATSYPTTNILFHELWKVQIELAQARMSQDTFVFNIINPLNEIFDRYWNDTSLVLATAVVMDPRYKIKFLELNFPKIYGEYAYIWVKNVQDRVQELFSEYIMQSVADLTSSHEGNDVLAGIEMLDEEESFSPYGLSDIDLSDFEYFELTSIPKMKNDLDVYLDEPLLSQDQTDFDVLGWWKEKSKDNGALSRMAADILTIPVSTLGPDSVFNTVSNEMDSYRTSLQLTTLESLICAKDWLQQGSSVFGNAIS